MKRLKKGVAAAAILIVCAAGAHAQTTDTNRNGDDSHHPTPPPLPMPLPTPPPVTDNRPTLPGWMFTPFPTNGGNNNLPKTNPLLPVKPWFSGNLPDGSNRNGGNTGTYPPGYPGYGYGYGYGYGGYGGYGGAGTSVIINQNPVIYPGNYSGSGELGYESTPPIVTVVQTDGRGRTRMSSFSGCVFSGYTSSFISGQSVLSPFGAYVGCPRYVYSRFALLSPYPYLNGYDSGIVIAPWYAGDPYLAANVRRGRALGTALRDFVLFWEQGNAAGLRRRVQPDIPVAVFNDGRFAYSVRRADYLALSADALDQVETVSFRFVDVRERNDGLVSAYALHTYRSRADGTTHTVRVRYTLVYGDGDWYLSAFSLSPSAP